MAGPTSVQRLTQALDLWLRHQSHPTGSHEQFLAEHEDLRELLEPMLRQVSPTAEPEASPRQLGDFRLVREIGRGGMGVVYEAVQQSLGRRVAVKVLAAPLALTPQAVARFRRESELLARLSHTHIVPVFEAGLEQGVPFHAMELVDGCTLADVLRGLTAAPPAVLDGQTLAAAQRYVLDDQSAGAVLVGRSHVDAAVRCAVAIADALTAAHASGILHRDVKPANVLLRRDGTALLSDFGLARDANDPNLTRAGDFAGTPYYVSPEQAAGDPTRVDQRTDVFSLAVVLYELLLLQRPFDGDTTDVVLERVRLAEPPALRRRARGLPEDLACVLDRALQKRREDRYATMAEFAEELRCVLALRPVRARRAGRVTRLLQAVRREPLRAGLLLAIGVGTPAVVGMSVYIWWNRPEIEAAARMELLPKVEVLLESVLLQQDFGDEDVAVAQAEAAVATMPDLPEARAALLAAHQLAHDAAASARDLTRLQQMDPDTASQMAPGWRDHEPVTALGWFMRGMRLMESGHADGDQANYRQAAQALRHAMGRASSPRAMFHCQYLHALSHLRDAAAIRESVDDIRHLWPRSPFAAYWRGFALEQQDPAGAIAELQLAIELAPELPQPYMRLAKVHEHANRYALARDLYARAAALAATPKSVAVSLARVMLLMGEKEAALAEIEATLKHYDSYMAHTVHGKVLAAMGRTAPAREAFDRAIARGPKAATPRLARADFLINHGCAAEGKADAEIAQALEPENPMVHSVLGVAILHLGRPAEAIPELELAVAATPERAYSWKLLSQASRQAHQLDGAEKAVQNLLRLAPDDPDTYAELGKLRSAQDRRGEAETALRHVIELRPTDGEARINLAGLRWQADAKDEALALLAEARQCAPSLPQGWQSAIWMLESLGRREQALALRVEYCAKRPKDRDERWAMLQAIVDAPAKAAQAEVLRGCLDELAAFGAVPAPRAALHAAALARLRELGR